MPPAADSRKVLAYACEGNYLHAAVTSLAITALAANGILAGLSLDKVIIQLPARRQIGVTAYAAYARAADLGNGIAFYPAVGVGAAALTVAAFAVAAALGAPGTVAGLLAAAAALSVVHSAMTGRAAPAMFNLGRAGDDPAALAPLLARFARWSAARAAAQTATLIVVAIAVAAGTGPWPARNPACHQHLTPIPPL